MKSKSIVIALLLCTMALLTGCNAGEETAWIMADASPDDTVTTIYMNKFAEEIERLSNGEIKVETYSNSTLGGDSEIIENCISGDIPFVFQNTAPTVSYVSELAVFDIPFAFKTIEEVREKVDDPEFLDMINQVYNDKGLKLLGMADQGFRVMSSNVKIEELSDFKGIKIRTMENNFHIACWQAIGANPSPLNFSEVYIGLQQGTIDAQENPYEVIASSKLYEQQDYVIETNHLPHLISMVMNDEFYEALTEEEQQIVDEAAALATEYAREQSDIRIDERKQIITDSGTEIIELSDEIYSQLVSNTASVYEEIRQSIGDELYNIYLAE